MAILSSQPERFIPLEFTLTLELLIPLSHPSELVTHPALSRTFKSNKIRVLAEQALNSIRTEHAHMTKLSKLLSILLGDENIFAEPEEIVAPPQPMDDSESDKDVDIMDLDDPSRDQQIANGEANGHSSVEADANGAQTNGTPNPPSTTDQNSTDTAQTTQAMETDDQPSQTDPNTTITNPPNGNGTTNTTSTPSRSPTPVTRPTTRQQTAATNPRPHRNDTEFTWPSSFMQSTPATSAADLGLSPAEASEVRRMVQAALERSQEFLRCLEKVRFALVRADKQRKMVWLWCKDSAKLLAEQEREEQ